MSMRQFAMEDPVRHLAWQVLCGAKVSEPFDQQLAALIYMRGLVDRKIQELGEEMGQVTIALKAINLMPSPSPSSVGEQEGQVACAEKAEIALPPASPASLDDVGHQSVASNGLIESAPSSTPNKAGEAKITGALKSQPPVAPPAFPTSQQRDAAERADAARLSRAVPRAAQTLSMQAFKIQGFVIAEMWHSQANEIIGLNWWHNAILAELRKIKLPYGKNDAKFGDYVTPGQWASIINKVGSVPNAT